MQTPSQADELTMTALKQMIVAGRVAVEVTPAMMIDLSTDLHYGNKAEILLAFHEDSLGRIHADLAEPGREAPMGTIGNEYAGFVSFSQDVPSRVVYSYSFERHSFKPPRHTAPAPAVPSELDAPIFIRSRHDGPAATRIANAARAISFRKRAIKEVWLSPEHVPGPCLKVPGAHGNSTQFIVIGATYAGPRMTKLNEDQIEKIADYLVARAARIADATEALIGLASEDFLAETAADFERAGRIWFGRPDYVNDRPGMGADLAEAIPVSQLNCKDCDRPFNYFLGFEDQAPTCPRCGDVA